MWHPVPRPHGIGSPARVLAALAPLALALVLGAVTPARAQGKRPNVLTTVAPLTNIARNVGGPHIDLRGLVPGGTDSHTFEPRPSDIRLIMAADLIVLNGLFLEVPTEKLALANKGAGARILKLGDATIARKDWVFDRSFPRAEGKPNPHLWMDPLYAARYEERTRRYVSRLEALDRAIATATATIPPQNRKLLTYHDSFAYFAPRYGLRVIGAIEPSSFAEPLPRDVARVIRQLRQEGVPAVFGSEVFPSKVLEQIAREAGVKFVDTLRDDDLPGAPGSPEHSYLGMMLEDVRAIVTALGGKADALGGIDPTDIP